MNTAAVFFALAVAAGPADSAKYDREAVEYLQKYLRIDTTNPPGNEIEAAQFFAEIFRTLGIKHEILEIAPGRANLFAVLKGDGTKKPIILSNHLDVVGVETSTWKVPPFSGELRDGEVWGRGALDMKGTAIVHLMVMRILQEQKIPLQRDVIFLGLADEEDGGTGAEWFKTHRRELIEGAEYFINEGANAILKNGKTEYYGVSTTEKTVLWLELEVTGTAGHGSTPAADNALNRMIAALDRLRRAETPISVIPSVASYFAGIADNERPELREKMKRAQRHVRDARFMRALTRNSGYNALVRNTVAITSVHAGDKVNVIPGKATALLDCRLLPGSDKEAFLDWLKGQLADPTITIKETLYFPTLESPVETDLMRAIRKIAGRLDPGAPVIALPLTGTTDSSVFRGMGMVAYGFEPFRLTNEELETQHGANERLSTRNLAYATQFMVELISELAARPGAP